MSCTFHRQKFHFCGKVIWIYRQNRFLALICGILQYLTGVVLPTDDHLLSWINTMAAAARRTRRVISAVKEQTNFTILKGIICRLQLHWTFRVVLHGRSLDGTSEMVKRWKKTLSRGWGDVLNSCVYRWRKCRLHVTTNKCRTATSTPNEATSVHCQPTSRVEVPTPERLATLTQLAEQNLDAVTAELCVRYMCNVYIRAYSYIAIRQLAPRLRSNILQ